VLRSTGDGFTDVASGYEDPLGGYDFDDALFDHIGHRYIEPRDPRLWQQLRGGSTGEISTQRHALRTRVHMAKELLTIKKTVTLRGVPGYPEPVTISCIEDYEPLIRGKVDQTIDALTTTLAEADLTATDLTAIYRIGGAARTPLVGAALDQLQCPVRSIDEPKLVVAQGAALRAARRATPSRQFVQTARADAPQHLDTLPRVEEPRRVEEPHNADTPLHGVPGGGSATGGQPGTAPSKRVPVALLVSCWILSMFPVVGLAFGLMARAQIKKNGQRGAGLTVPIIIIGVVSTVWLLGKLAAG
jgi:hypothetical protein